MTTTQFLAVLHGLTGAGTAARLEASSVIEDLMRDLSERQAAVLAYVLTSVVLGEPDDECLEAELLVLSDLAQLDLAPPHMYEEVARLPRERLRESQAEHYDSVLECLP
jgi:hypothetical protein